MFISYVAMAACQRQWKQMEAGRPSIECYPSSTGANVATFGSWKCRLGLNILPTSSTQKSHAHSNARGNVDSWFRQRCLPRNHFLQLATGLHASRGEIFHHPRLPQSNCLEILFASTQVPAYWLVVWNIFYFSIYWE